MATFKKSMLLVSLSSFFIISTFGCSVFMAASQPSTRNVELFKVGTARNTLLAEFGLPTSSEFKDTKRSDVFKFVQGYSVGARAGRAVFHGVADVVTLFLWEVIGTPTEAIFNGEEMAFEVSYDVSDRVDQVITLKRN